LDEKEKRKYRMNVSTRYLLMCGIFSSLWYVAINAMVPLYYPGYSLLDHTPSELSAVGAPTRTLWLIAVAPYMPLFAAFGWGVLRVAMDNRALRITGFLILAYCVWNFYWPPMHTREVLAAGGGTLSDTLHLVWAGVTVALFVLIMGFGAASQERGFRFFTIVSAVLLIFFGFLTSQLAPNVGANLPTPWIGVYERINIAVFLVWVMVFAAQLLRASRQPNA
jgi:hypothetical protein